MIFLINEFLFNAFMEIAINLFLVPQIIHNVIRGQLVDFDVNFIIMFMCTRSLLPVFYIINANNEDNFLIRFISEVVLKTFSEFHQITILPFQFSFF